MSLHTYKIPVREIRKETSDCVSIAFDIPDQFKQDFDFLSGQYLTLCTDIQGESVRRSYSLCSWPGESEWRVAVKKVPGGKFSTFANTILKKGDILELFPPAGKFCLPPAPASQKQNHLFIAAGSGITPVISLIKQILNARPFDQIILLYGNRSSDSVIFKRQLFALKDKFMNRLSLSFILSQEETDEPFFTGRINPEKISEVYGKLFNKEVLDQVFICGPEKMIFELKEYFQKKGLAEHQIHFELFGTEGIPERFKVQSEEQSQVGTSQVSIKVDGRIIQFNLAKDGPSVLDAALAQKANLPFACKGGVCCTCKAKLTKGKVNMKVNYGLEPDEIDAGYILSCQSHPVSDEIEVDFD